jgi:hypothetical protein
MGMKMLQNIPQIAGVISLLEGKSVTLDKYNTIKEIINSDMTNKLKALELAKESAGIFKRIADTLEYSDTGAINFYGDEVTPKDNENALEKLFLFGKGTFTEGQKAIMDIRSKQGGGKFMGEVRGDIKNINSSLESYESAGEALKNLIEDKGYAPLDVKNEYAKYLRERYAIPYYEMKTPNAFLKAFDRMTEIEQKLYLDLITTDKGNTGKKKAEVEMLVNNRKTLAPEEFKKQLNEFLRGKYDERMIENGYVSPDVIESTPSPTGKQIDSKAIEFLKKAKSSGMDIEQAKEFLKKQGYQIND